LSFEAAEGFFVGFALGELLFEIGLSGWMNADLGDRDAVQCGVELAVAAGSRR
jgi:hypothetical protein